MKNNKFIAVVTKTANKMAFTTKKHAPEILLFTGLVTIAGGVVYACRQSVKLPDVIAKHNVRMDEITDVARTEEGDIVTVEPDKKEVAKVYCETGLDLVKLYVGPAVVLGAGAGCILASHGMMSNRNAALSAAYASVNTAFNDYRERVANKYGKDVEEELRYNLESKTVKNKETDENGETKVVKEKVQVVNEPEESGYARYFTPNNPYWENDDDLNKCFLNRVQRYSNDLLRSRGYIYLNDVYKEMGLKQSKAGQIVGWRYKKDNENGDNMVQFTVKRVQIPATENPEDGYMPALLLDFNVDGNIFDVLGDDEYFEL